LALPWKIEDWESYINELLNNEDLLFEVAKNGQNKFKKLWLNQGKEEFCYRFINLINR